MCALCAKKVRTAKDLLEHISNEHNITLWKQSEAEEEQDDDIPPDDTVEDNSVNQNEYNNNPQMSNLSPLEISVRLLQLKWMINNHPKVPAMEPSVRTKGCVISGRNTCEYCGKIFVNLSNLTVHRRSHTGEKPYQCNVCDYTTAQSSKLTRHMKIHVKHKCNFCSKIFHSKAEMDLHNEEHHTNNKAYFKIPVKEQN